MIGSMLLDAIVGKIKCYKNFKQQLLQASLAPKQLIDFSLKIVIVALVNQNI